MPGHTSTGDYILATIALSIGIFLDYMCAIFFGGWLESRNPAAIFSVLLFGMTSVLFLYMGMVGTLHRPWRDVRVFEDGIVFRSQWRFDDSQTFIPMQSVWKLYTNIKNDFPAWILVWKDEHDRCRANLFDKEDLPDFQNEVANLKERVIVDTDSYAITSFVNDEVRSKLGCEPTW